MLLASCTFVGQKTCALHEILTRLVIIEISNSRFLMENSILKISGSVDVKITRLLLLIWLDMNYFMSLREYCHGKSHFQSEEIMGKIHMIVTIQSIELYVRLKIIQNQQCYNKDLMFLSPFQLLVKKMSVLLCCFINSQNSEFMGLTKLSKVR